MVSAVHRHRISLSREALMRLFDLWWCKAHALTRKKKVTKRMPSPLPASSVEPGTAVCLVSLKEIRKGSSQRGKKKNRASLSLFTWYRAKSSKPDVGLESEGKRE